MIRNCSRIVAACMVLLAPLAPEAIGQTDEEDHLRNGVTGVTEPRDGYPEISPDGKRIVFQSNRSGTCNCGW